MPAFASAVYCKADGSEAALAGNYLASLSHVLAAWVPLERGVLGVEPPTELASLRSSDEQGAQGCADC